MAAQPDREELRAMLDDKSRGFVRPPIEEGASGHICKSGEEKFTRILPYPPPLKSLGAKTNHLPNIQGFACPRPLQDGLGTKNFGWNRPSGRLPRTEVILIPSNDANPGFRVPIQGVIGRADSRPLGRRTRILRREIVRSAFIQPPTQATTSDWPPTS